MYGFHAGVDGQKRVELDCQQDPPHLAPCSSRVKVRTKEEKIFSWIRQPAQRLFIDLPLFVNLWISSLPFWIVEDWNNLYPSTVHILLQVWDFFESFTQNKIIHGLTLV